MKKAISVEVIAAKILLIRGKKVMLDSDLALLYEVSVKRLNEQVRRNKRRFPNDFMFELTVEETKALRSQNATLEKGRGRHSKYLPCAFTEHGILMLSSVLSSERAIEVNIAIMRVFVRLREFVLAHKELTVKIEALEKKYAEHDQTIKAIFEAIKELLEPPTQKQKVIRGFCRE